MAEEKERPLPEATPDALNQMSLAPGQIPAWMMWAQRFWQKQRIDPPCHALYPQSPCLLT